MSNEMNRRKFLKLTGAAVLATSVAGALGGCSGGGRESWTKTGVPRGYFTKEQLTAKWKNDFQTELTAPGRTTIKEDVYVGIGVQEREGIVWHDVIFVHEGE